MHTSMEGTQRTQGAVDQHQAAVAASDAVHIYMFVYSRSRKAIAGAEKLQHRTAEHVAALTAMYYASLASQ
jgi:hypothetical protein